MIVPHETKGDLMRVQLRDYQIKIENDLRLAYRQGYKAPLLVSPTGSGKTVVFADITEKAADKGKRVMILVHRKELVRQCSDALFDLNIRHGIIAPGHSMTADSVQIASVQTLVRRLDKIAMPDLMILDEGHHVVAGSWKKILTYYGFTPKEYTDEEGNTKRFYPTDITMNVLAVTATPIRLDGKGLSIDNGGFYDTLVHGPNIKELISQGYLSQPIVYAPPNQLDLRGIHKKYGDYDKHEIADLMDKPTITGDCVAHYLKLCCKNRDPRTGVSSIVFAASIKHATHIAEVFNKAGVRAESLDGTMSDRDRKYKISALGDGRIQVLTSCEIVSEGTDIPVVTAAILLRPTQSLGLYLQQCLDEKTEILTLTGWENIDTFTEGSVVATFNTKNNKIEWQKSKDKIKRERAYSEDMYSIKSQMLDIRVTGGHNIIYMCNGGTSKNWQRQTAEKLANNKKYMYKIPIAGISELRGIPLKNHELEFVGWFLTDGTLNKKTKAITISQSKKSIYNKDIIEMLEKCNFKYGLCEVKRTGEYSHCAPNMMYTVSYGKPRGTKKHMTGWKRMELYLNKKLSKYLFGMSRNQLKILLATMNKGDGSKGNTLDYTRRTYTITTGDNKILSERLQELCITNGFRCNLSEHHYGKSPWYYLYIKDVMTSTIPGTNNKDESERGFGRRTRFSKETCYKEENVWCITTKNGTLVTRRYGKIAILGNCGRCLRPHPAKKNSIILDHVGNVYRHGLPDEIREWDLNEGIKEKDHKGEQSPNKQCANCYLIYPRDLKECPACGYKAEIKNRTIEEVDGELQEIKEAEIRKEQWEKRSERGNARTLEELQELGRARGYHKDWAIHVFNSRPENKQ